MDNRKIDRLVAEKIMGWKYYPEGHHISNELTWIGADGGWYIKCPNYSTDIAAAWEVVEKLQKEYIVSILGPDDQGTHWCVDIMSKNQKLNFANEVGNTAPMAICLAALKAKGV